MFKKYITGGPITARLPHDIAPHLMESMGWRRLEVNAGIALAGAAGSSQAASLHASRPTPAISLETDVMDGDVPTAQAGSNVEDLRQDEGDEAAGSGASDAVSTGGQLSTEDLLSKPTAPASVGRAGREHGRQSKPGDTDAALRIPENSEAPTAGQCAMGQARR